MGPMKAMKHGKKVEFVLGSLLAKEKLVWQYSVCGPIF